MAGISDLPYRLINRSFGCELAFTEMISAISLVHKCRKTMKMLSAAETDKPLGVQILGGDPEIVKRALDIIAAYAFEVVDFNAACPVDKVASKGKGAGLLREPGKLQQILRVIVAHAGVPVTVKIRSGWDDSSVNAVEIARRAQDSGVSGLFIHGRTRMQKYRGNVDYRIIREVKESLEIPVIASGDALTPDLIKKMFDETGCDGVAIARGALGNPWIFRETAEQLAGGKAPSGRDVSDVVCTMKRHLELNIASYGEKTGVMLFRKLFAWYVRGMSVKELKSRAFRAETGEEMLLMIDELQTFSPARDRCLV